MTDRVEAVHFADGFDSPDRVLFGMGAWQLLAAAASLVASVLVVRSPLPRPAALPAVILSLAAGAVLGWMRFAGRPALEWAGFAVRFATGPRQGIALLESVAAAAAAPVATPAAGQSEPSNDSAAAGERRIIPLRPRTGGHPAITPLDPPRLRARTAGARRLVVFSLQRGAGRTMLATELSVLLARTAGQRVRVALVDLDACRPTVSSRLRLPTSKTLRTFLLDDPDLRRVTEHMVRHESGVAVLCGSEQIGAGGAASDSTGREILRELDLERFDVVVVDLAAELTSLTSAALRAADIVLVVCTPTPDGVHATYRTTETLHRLGLRRQLRYVINRARRGVAVGEMIDDLKADVVAQIPDDPCVAAAAAQRSAIASWRGSDAAAALRGLAAHLQLELDATW